VFGDPKLGFQYGILAGISSFIFQLPLQLCFLECHSLEQRRLENVNKNDENHEESNYGGDEKNKDLEAGSEDFEEIEIDKAVQQQIGAALKRESLPPAPSCILDSNNANATTTSGVSRFGNFTSPDVWKKILLQLLRNPVLWAIAVGFVLTLSTVGPRFLNPNSSDYVPGLGWVFITLAWLGDIVSPLSLFAMGVWMQEQWKTLFRIPLLSATLFMISKLVIVPLITLFLAMGLNLDDQSGRAAVLIASLPISLASFVLGSRYNIGEAVLSENVALGTILILPTILVWSIVLDEVGVFPIPESST
jgi:hypothetical protein